jgi:adenylate kinase family enzyme
MTQRPPLSAGRIRWVIRRVRVVGNSGAGKTQLARRVAGRLGVPHLELDAINHQPGWREATVAEFQADLRRFVNSSEETSGGWVVDGNYSSRVGDLLDQADTVVWLDYPRLLVLGRVVRRTWTRHLLRQELWNGNRERWRSLLSIRPEDNIILSSWTRHGHYRRRYEAAAASAPSARWIRLRTPAAAAGWLRELTR